MYALTSFMYIAYRKLLARTIGAVPEGGFDIVGDYVLLSKIPEALHLFCTRKQIKLTSSHEEWAPQVSVRTLFSACANNIETQYLRPSVVAEWNQCRRRSFRMKFNVFTHVSRLSSMLRPKFRTDRAVRDIPYSRNQQYFLHFLGSPNTPFKTLKFWVYLNTVVPISTRPINSAIWCGPCSLAHYLR